MPRCDGVIANLLSGQYERPLKIIAFNARERQRALALRIKGLERLLSQHLDDLVRPRIWSAGLPEKLMYSRFT
jgi:hypothetical protein